MIQHPFSDDARRAIDAILSVIETGSAEGDYSQASVLDDGAGITYGLHQATDRSDSMDKILRLYVELGGARASEVSSYLPRLARNETAGMRPGSQPAWAEDLLALLRELGAEETMRTAQRRVFEQHYWTPAARQAAEMGLVHALSWCVVYDTCIHSGPDGVWQIRRLFPGAPPAQGGQERAWVRAYLAARASWLGSSSSVLVRSTVYRIDLLADLARRGLWDLEPPFAVRLPGRWVQIR